MRRLRAAVKAERPAALVSVAAAPDLREACDAPAAGLGRVAATTGSSTRSARWPTRRSRRASRSRSPRARAAAGGRAVWAGIGAYRLSPAQTIENIQTARRLGAAGVVLFSYDSLIDPRQIAPDYLAVVGRAAFADAPPRPPTARADGPRRAWSSPGSTTPSSPATCSRSRRSAPGSRASRKPPATTS